MEDRVTELEIKVVHMEDYLNTLNDVLIRQQAHIEALRARIEQLNDRLQAGGSPPMDIDPSAEKPPHY
jgi:uncharacterized coiled-coil protein SlyX